MRDTSVQCNIAERLSVALQHVFFSSRYCGYGVSVGCIVLEGIHEMTGEEEQRTGKRREEKPLPLGK